MLSELKIDETLTFTRAYKGNTILIMDTDDYDHKMNTSFWIPLFTRNWISILRENM